MPTISKTLRRQVRERARGLCEYCQAAELIIVRMEIDHIQPQSAQGASHLDNLCFVCPGCNSFKGDFQTGVDPQTGEEVPLFNPRTEIWSDHFVWSSDGLQLVGLTVTARATIARLKINRQDVIASRRLWVLAGWHPPRDGVFPLD